VRATVAHDSYERLVSIDCGGDENAVENIGVEGLTPIGKTVRDPKLLGLESNRLASPKISTARLDKQAAIQRLVRAGSLSRSFVYPSAALMRLHPPAGQSSAERACGKTCCIFTLSVTP
jgi:hypothetical protein